VQYVRVLGFALASAYLVFALVETRELTEGLLRTGGAASLLASYFRYFWPGILHLVLPVASLVAAVVAFTLFGRTGELVAIRASGISLRRATLPVLGLATLSGVALFFVQDRLAPSFNRDARVVKDEIMGRPPRTYHAPLNGSWSFGPEGSRLYHYRLFDAAAGEFQGLSVFTLRRDPPRIVDHRFARRAHWTGATWELEGGWYRTFPQGDEPASYERFDSTVRVALDPPSTFTDQQISIGRVGDIPDTLSLAELGEQIDALERRGYDVTQLEVAWHSKFAQAASPLVMVLIGLPFAFRIGRRGSLYGIGVALLLVLVYWAALAIFNALGLETLVQPVVAAWAPNVLFGLAGLYLLLWVPT
jgi:LPS export ABC transporter permease LptG